MSYWTHIAETPPTPKRELTKAQAAAVEEALETARAWADGELTTDQALILVMESPRVMGLAFQHFWQDERRPALERLHMLEYGQRYRMTYTDFGWLPNHIYDQVVRNTRWRRQWDDDRNVA